MRYACKNILTYIYIFGEKEKISYTSYIYMTVEIKINHLISTEFFSTTEVALFNNTSLVSIFIIRIWHYGYISLNSYKRRAD